MTVHTKSGNGHELDGLSAVHARRCGPEASKGDSVIGFVPPSPGDCSHFQPCAVHDKCDALKGDPGLKITGIWGMSGWNILSGDFQWMSRFETRARSAPRSGSLHPFLNHQTHHLGQAQALLTAGQRTGDTNLFLGVL